MKRNQKIITISLALLLIAGAAAWYFTTNKKQASEQSQQQAATASEASTADDNKFAKLTGEAFDEAYIADMIAHHEGAVNMAELAGGAAERQEIRELSQAIVKTQSQEIAKMRTWQQDWGYEITMGGHGSHSGQANSMAGDMMDMGAELANLTGAAFDKKFIELMIVHHEQAVEMSEYADTNALHQEIKNLASDVITAQKAEIAQMKQWQKDWGYATTSSDEMPSSMPGMSH